MRRTASEDLDGRPAVSGEADPTDDATADATDDPAGLPSEDADELTDPDRPTRVPEEADPASPAVVEHRAEPSPDNDEQPDEDTDDSFWADPAFDDGEPTTPRTAPWLTRWWVRSDLGLYLASLLFSCFAAAQAIDLWSADLTAPFAYLNDATAILAHFKTVLETGWYEYQPMLGAPVGQNVPRLSAGRQLPHDRGPLPRAVQLERRGRGERLLPADLPAGRAGGGVVPPQGRRRQDR